MALTKIGVVGAGMMGSEIALVMALAGKHVRLTDRDQAALDRTVANLAGVLDKGIQRGFYQPEDKKRALGNIETTLDLGLYRDREAVIEAVFEDEKIKGEIYRKFDAIVGPN